MRLYSHQSGFLQGPVSNAQLELTTGRHFCHVFGLQFLDFHRLQCSLRVHGRPSYSFGRGSKRRQFPTLSGGHRQYTGPDLPGIHFRSILGQPTLLVQHIFGYLRHIHGFVQPLGQLLGAGFFLCRFWNHFWCLRGIDFRGAGRSFGLG